MSRFPAVPYQATAAVTGVTVSRQLETRTSAGRTPEARAVMDLGALHGRAMKANEKARVLSHQMTGQCASGSGSSSRTSRAPSACLADVGPLSLQSNHPEPASSICAVLAETDVINMVSRGIATPDIIRRIHESIGQRLVRLLSALKADSPLVLTGGMSRDVGIVEVIRRRVVEDGLDLEVRTPEDGVFAGAIGAALWAGWRHHKLLETSGPGPREARTAD